MGMVDVLEAMGCEDGGYKGPVTQPGSSSSRRFNPDGDVDGEVEDETQQPVCKPHCALAARSVGV